MTTLTTRPDSFYVAGGTLPADASSYVEREADRQLLASLLAGEYCYVLNSRQMGKSSLSVRTIARLKEDGVRTVFLDLTKYGGRNLSPEQWYAALLSDAGRELGLRTEFRDWWKLKEEEQIGPMQRLFGALTDLALMRSDCRIVVIIDEIDVTLSLPFSADEFFTAIRQCYVGRAANPDLCRLSFCLIGTATPTDLVQDTRVSPFNIGRRIELQDFTPAEAAPLAQGFGANSAHLLNRVLYWTGGHPYLTQRLCRSCVERGARTREDVDRACTELFLTHSAKESDDNLSFVRNRMLRGTNDLSSLLTLYGQVRANEKVIDDETNPLIGSLKLSGVVRVYDGRIHVRNRIYRHVFDRRWTETHMPDAELRRQRDAYRKGWTRSVAVSSAIIVTMAALIVVANYQRLTATEAERRALSASVRENEVRGVLEERLYSADMSVAQQALESGDLGTARELLEVNRPVNVGPLLEQDTQGSIAMRYFRADRRGFEWRYLWQSSRGDEIATLSGHKGIVRAMAVSPNNDIVATGGDDGAIILWQRDGFKQAGLLKVGDGITAIEFSPDGALIAAGGAGGRITLWDLRTRRRASVLDCAGDGVVSLQGSPDGTRLMSGHRSGKVRFWNWRSAAMTSSFVANPAGITCLACSPSSQAILAGGNDSTIRVWNSDGSKLIRTIPWGGRISCLAASSIQRVAVVGDSQGMVGIVSLSEGARIRRFAAHRGEVASLALGRDGSRFFTGGRDSAVTERDTLSGSEIRRFQGHTGSVYAVACTSDGREVFSGGGRDASKRLAYPIRVFDSSKLSDPGFLSAAGSRPTFVAFLPGNTLVSYGEGDRALHLWDVKTRRPEGCLAVDPGANAVGVDVDGSRAAAGGRNGFLCAWDLRARRLLWSERMKGATVSCLCFDASGRSIAVGGQDGSLHIVDAGSGRETARWQAGERAVTAVAFVLDRSGKPRYAGSLAAATADGVVSLWDVTSSSGKRRSALTVDAPSWVGFSPDGRYLAATSRDGYTVVWDLHSGAPGSPKYLRSPSPQTAAFTTDGKGIAVGGQDKGVVLWNLSTEQKMLTLSGQAEPSCGLAFSAGDTWLASASGVNRIKLWQAPPLAIADPESAGLQEQAKAASSSLPNGPAIPGDLSHRSIR